ncbi:hypothetical protein PMAYCL1PPCAC_22764, partial [Pristionchus mayeri]
MNKTVCDSWMDPVCEKIRKVIPGREITRETVCTRMNDTTKEETVIVHKIGPEIAEFELSTKTTCYPRFEPASAQFNDKLAQSEGGLCS